MNLQIGVYQAFSSRRAQHRGSASAKQHSGEWGFPGLGLSGRPGSTASQKFSYTLFPLSQD
jgi:hypothetical protein